MSSEGPVEFWIAVDPGGVSLAWEEAVLARRHAIVMGQKFPEQGPWRVVRYVEGGVVEDLEHLVRFLARAWMDAEEFVYRHTPPEDIGNYPVVQGTSNQVDLMKIAGQSCDTGRLHAAVRRMLEDVGGVCE